MHKSCHFAFAYTCCLLYCYKEKNSVFHDSHKTLHSTFVVVYAALLSVFLAGFMRIKTLFMLLRIERMFCRLAPAPVYYKTLLFHSHIILCLLFSDNVFPELWPMALQPVAWLLPRSNRGPSGSFSCAIQLVFTYILIPTPSSLPPSHRSRHVSPWERSEHDGPEHTFLSFVDSLHRALTGGCSLKLFSNGKMLRKPQQPSIEDWLE